MRDMKTPTLTAEIRDGNIVFTGSSTLASHGERCGCPSCYRERNERRARELDTHDRKTCQCSGCHDRRDYDRAVELEASRNAFARLP